MVITWHGLSAFEIETKQGDEPVRLVMDPYAAETGLKFPKLPEAAVVAVSKDTPSHNYIAGVAGAPYLITGPGEYEVKGIFVYGVDAKPFTLLRVEVEGMSIAHLGGLDRELTDAELAQFPSTDILMVPVGGNAVMKPEMAMKMIEKLEPRIVIPMYYEIPGVAESLLPLSEFQRVYANTNVEVLPKLKLKKAELPADQTLVKILTRA